MAESRDEQETSVHQGDPDARGKRITPWAWVPSVNFAQGLQFIVVTQLVPIIFFTLGMPIGQTLFWAGMLTLPWTIKPLWGPLVDRYGSKRLWTIWMQFIVGLCFLGAAFAMLLPDTPFAGTTLPLYFAVAVAFLFVLAFAGASHDIACDGFYMMGLSQKKQAFFVGVRSTAFRAAMIFATGFLVWLAQFIQDRTGLPPTESEVQIVVADQTPASDWAPTAPTTGQRIILSPAVLTTAAGEPTSLTVTLAQAPAADEKVVVVVRHGGGDKSVALNREDARIVLTAENWNAGVPVRITSDVKIRESTTAYFTAAAGNLSLSWALIIGLTGAMFLGFFALHQVTMPVVASDVSDGSDRPNILIPLFWLAVTIGVPWGVSYLAMWGMHQLRPTMIQTLFDGTEPTGTTAKGFNFAFNATRYIVLIIAWVVVMKIAVLRDKVLAGFRWTSRQSGVGFFDVFASFVTKPGIGIVIGFLLTFRLGEAQLAQIKNIFLLAPRETGGVAMSMGELAFTNSVVYLGALTVGGLLGGFLIARYGLKAVIWPMVAAMHLPNLLYVYLATFQPDSLLTVNLLVATESFGYGFGFTSFLMVMIMSADGPYKTAHYALCTGFMSLGMMIPGMWSGFLQEVVGFTNFFWLVMLFCIPGILFIPFLPIDSNFGRKAKAAA